MKALDAAAAVACGMVPLALGSQTNGSVIRPASFCGAFGYKPIHGLVSRHGVLALSRPLDTVGVFARSVEDLALIGESIMTFDDRDSDMRPAASARLLDTVSQEPPLPPNLVFVRTPVWDEAEADCRAAFAELVETLAGHVDEFQLPETFDNAVAWHKTIMHADLTKSLAREYQQGREQLSDRLRTMIEKGQEMLAVDYNRAVDWIGVLNRGLEEVFERYDAIVMPGAPGQAPPGLDAPGNPVFCTLWTYLGLPAVSLPLLQDDDGLPVGVQLVGARGDDARLLRTARWLVERLGRVDQG